MKPSEWLTSTTGQSLAEIANETGISRRTLYSQAEKERFSVDNLRTISRHYDFSVVEAMLAMRLISAQEAKIDEVGAALRQATDEQLTDEILRRLKGGSTAFDTSPSDVEQRSNVTHLKSARPDIPQGAVADDSDWTPEGDPGDYDA